MPTGPKGEKRKADVIGNAVHIMRIATGEAEDRSETQKKGRSLVASLGGSARSQKLTPQRRSEIAKQAAKAKRPFRSVPSEKVDS